LVELPGLEVYYLRILMLFNIFLHFRRYDG
jgi:hypothetical protein